MRNISIRDNALYNFIKENNLKTSQKICSTLFIYLLKNDIFIKDKNLKSKSLFSLFTFPFFILLLFFIFKSKWYHPFHPWFCIVLSLTHQYNWDQHNWQTEKMREINYSKMIYSCISISYYYKGIFSCRCHLHIHSFFQSKITLQ